MKNVAENSCREVKFFSKVKIFPIKNRNFPVLRRI